MWCQVYPTLSEGKHGLFGAVVSRSEAQVVRLACVYALLDCSAVIRSTHLMAALAVWEYCEQSARYVFRGSLGNPLADQIVSMLRDRPTGLTRTEIHAQVGRHRKADELDEVLQVLTASGRAHGLT